jgi:hypothetical protein
LPVASTSLVMVGNRSDAKPADFAAASSHHAITRES